TPFRRRTSVLNVHATQASTSTPTAPRIHATNSMQPSDPPGNPPVLYGVAGLAGERGQGLKTARWYLAVVAGVVALIARGLWSSVNARAPEGIREFGVTFAVSVAGNIDVREVITYDCGSRVRHGLLRDIPVRFYYDDVHDRVFR